MTTSDMLRRLPGASVYLFAIGITIWAFLAPYLNFQINMMGSKANVDVYLTKECVDNQCSTPTSYKDKDTVLTVLYSVYLALAVLCFALYLYKPMGTLYNIAGLCIFAVALAAMITLIVIVKTSNFTILGSTFYSSLTSVDITMIIAFCFIMVKQFFSNGYFRALFRMLQN
jgi:hypothetical protein